MREVEAYRKPIRPRGTDAAKVIQVIETRSLRGVGTDEDKCRCVIQYWDFEGNLLAENDPCAEEKVKNMGGERVR
ncbi:MAG: carboxypeptidase [Lacrimispora sp.]|uniref:carboxypeptidase n=1 Tax=Lacrimispora sp. TaxID=2719234 RepID=UPI0039E48BC0